MSFGGEPTKTQVFYASALCLEDANTGVDRRVNLPAAVDTSLVLDSKEAILGASDPIFIGTGIVTPALSHTDNIAISNSVRTGNDGVVFVAYLTTDGVLHLGARQYGAGQMFGDALGAGGDEQISGVI